MLVEIAGIISTLSLPDNDDDDGMCSVSGAGARTYVSLNQCHIFAILFIIAPDVISHEVGLVDVYRQKTIMLFSQTVPSYMLTRTNVPAEAAKKMIRMNIGKYIHRYHMYDNAVTENNQRVVFTKLY